MITQGSRQRPADLGPFAWIVGVGWGSAYLLVEATGSEAVLGIRLQVINPAGGEIARFDPLTAQDPDEIFQAGLVVDKLVLQPYRFARTSIEALEPLVLPGNGAILGWTDGMAYSPTNDTGSSVGLFDPCRNAGTGLYVGDVSCEDGFRGGDIPSGGVARHLYIQDVLNKYSSDPLKRVRYSHQGSPDQRFHFIDDPSPEPPDLSLFKAERAIVQDASFLPQLKVYWLVNFARAPRAIMLRVMMEEPEPAGGSIPNSTLRIRRWATPAFKIEAAPSGDGVITRYTGTRSPSIDQVQFPITWNGEGEIRKFKSNGFVD